jgi:hypothetical protein
MSIVEYPDFEIEIGSATAGTSPQQYYGKVIKSPGGETHRCQVKFRFSEPGVLARLRADLESAVLEIDDKNHRMAASKNPIEMVEGDFQERGFVVMVDEDGKPVKRFASDLATMLVGPSGFAFKQDYGLRGCNA